MSVSPEDMAAIVAAVMAAQATPAAPAPVDAVTAKVLADAPKRQTPRKAADTAAKLTAVTRNVNALLLHGGKLRDHPAGAALPDSGVGFVVAAASGEGRLFSRGARVSAIVNGKPERSMTLAVIDALSEDGMLESLRNAIESVDKRAMLGAHKPAAAEKVAA